MLKSKRKRANGTTGRYGSLFPGAAGVFPSQCQHAHFVQTGASGEHLTYLLNTSDFDVVSATRTREESLSPAAALGRSAPFSRHILHNVWCVLVTLSAV